MDKGTIIERGTHRELIQENGHYKRIFDLQYKDQEMIVSSHQAG
jgi:ATP-binding cassette subfamily B protein